MGDGLARDIARFGLSDHRLRVLLQQIPVVLEFARGFADRLHIFIVRAIPLLEGWPRIAARESLGLRFRERDKAAEVAAHLPL